jgi:8-oxo-dGTP diphosphatase
MKMVLVAAAALVDDAGRVLVAQRPEGKALAGLWEFPGGKVEAGERPEEALARELFEELGVAVRASDMSPFAFASHAYDGFHLLMPLWLCRRWAGEARGLEGQAVRWLPIPALDADEMPPADVSLVAALKSWAAGL